MLRKLTLQVDERLLFKLLQFFGWVYNDDDVTVNQDSENLGIETHRYYIRHRHRYARQSEIHSQSVQEGYKLI